MFHITHFVLIFSFAVGLAAITVSAQMYMRYRLGYLRAHLAIVVCFNLMLFLSIITLYLFGLPPGAVPEFVLRSMGWTHQFLTPLLQILAAYFFMQIISGLLEMPVRRLFRNVAWAVIGGYATLQFTALVTSISAGNMPLSLLIARIVWLGSLGAIYAMLIASLPRVGGVEDLGRRRALKAYWYLIMGLMTVILALIVLNGIGYLQIARYNLVTGLVIVVMNAVPRAKGGRCGYHRGPDLSLRALRHLPARERGHREGLHGKDQQGDCRRALHIPANREGPRLPDIPQNRREKPGAAGGPVHSPGIIGLRHLRLSRGIFSNLFPCVHIAHNRA
jgi:hypothetical protein